MPSDKHNLVMATREYRLDFFTNQCRLSPRYAFLPTAEVLMFASWLQQNLPLFSFVLHSFLHYHIQQVTICSTLVMPLVQTWVSAVLARGTSYAIPYMDCYPKCLKQLKTKLKDERQSRDIPTILIDNWGARLNDQKFCIFHNEFCIFCNGWINCRYGFHAVLHL